MGNRFNPKPKKNLLGQRFGRWLVIAEAPSVSRTQWLCRCDCGVEKNVLTIHLTRGKSVSCGCYKDEKTAARLKTHRMTESDEYRIWSLMKGRCCNPNIPHYDIYGGRGIRVCDRWLESFEAFYSDMGPRPSKEYSIDRINNNGNYEPGNVRWATDVEQARNTRRNVYVIYEGERIALSEAAERSGINYGTLKWRLGAGKDLFAPVGG